MTRPILKAVVVLCGSLVLAWPAAVPAATRWQAEAAVQMDRAGSVVLTLPAGLQLIHGEGLDLVLVGPDQGLRTLELFWSEETRSKTLELRPDSETLSGKTFVWTASIPEPDRFQVREVRISVLADDYVGRVNIFGERKGLWIALARDAAVYSAQHRESRAIRVQEGAWEGLRLEFSPYGKKPVPIGQVSVAGETPGLKPAVVSDVLPVKVRFAGDETVLQVRLPGPGLFLKKLTVVTESRFGGEWTLERPEFVNGVKTSVAVLSGRQTGTGMSLVIEPQRIWEGREILVRLKTGGKTIGAVRRVTTELQVPYVAFAAERPGTYRLRSGTDESVRVHDVAMGRWPAELSAARVGPVVPNSDWRPEDLLTGDRLRGAPFSDTGYAWKLPVKVYRPGYFRFILPQKAGLEPNLSGMRLALQGEQVPYYFEEGKETEAQVNSETETEPKTNTTIWTLDLPQASPRWKAVRLTAAGVFRRTVRVERDIPEAAGKVLWPALEWADTDLAGDTVLSIPLDGFPPGEDRLRVVIAHGDNQPLRLIRVTAVYLAPAVLFLARAGGDFELFGGDPDAASPEYDLGLFLSRLADAEPETVQPGQVQTVRSEDVWSKMLRPFRKTRWGLYAVLGALTLVLVAVVVRLFPRIREP